MEINNLHKEFEDIYFGEIPESEKKIHYYTLLSMVRPNKIWPWTLTQLRNTLFILYHRFFLTTRNVKDIADDHYDIGNSRALCIFNTKLLNKYDQEIYVVSEINVNDNTKTKFIGFLTSNELKEKIDDLLEYTPSTTNKTFVVKNEKGILESKRIIKDLSRKDIFPLQGANFDYNLYSEYIKFNINVKDISTEDTGQINKRIKAVLCWFDKKKEEERNQKEKKGKNKGNDNNNTDSKEKDQKKNNQITFTKAIRNSELHGWAHLIIDGADNLPVSILNFVFQKEYRFYKPEYIQHEILTKEAIIKLVVDEKEKGKKEEIVIWNKDNYNVLKAILKKAFEHTEQLVRYNHTLAPMYYIQQNTMSYIAPLYITYGEKPDCVVLLNKDEEDPYKFIPTTLLNLEEARRNVNILGLLDHYATWLL